MKDSCHSGSSADEAEETAATAYKNAEAAQTMVQEVEDTLGLVSEATTAAQYETDAEKAMALAVAATVAAETAAHLVEDEAANAAASVSRLQRVSPRLSKAHMAACRCTAPVIEKVASRPSTAPDEATLEREAAEILKQRSRPTTPATKPKLPTIPGSPWPPPSEKYRASSLSTPIGSMIRLDRRRRLRS